MGQNKSGPLPLKREDKFIDEICTGDQKPIRIPQKLMAQLPHNLIGALTFQNDRKQVKLGTAVLISPDLLLTAAHNLIDPNFRIPYKSFRFYPGQHGPLEEYYNCTSWYVPEAFLKKNCSKNDYALLKLQKLVPIEQFMEIKPVYHIAEDEEIAVFGYLHEDFKSKNPYNKYEMELYQSGLTGSPEMVQSFRQKQGDILYALSTTFGQSGAPILLLKKGRPPSIIGIHKGGIIIDEDGKQKRFNCGKHLRLQMIRQLKQQAQKLESIPFKISQLIALLEEGEKLILQERWKEAEQYFSLALEEEPDHLMALCKIGRTQLEQQKYEEAMKVTAKALSISPKCAQAYSNRGWALCGKNKFEETINDCKMALAIDSNIKEAYNNIGFALNGLNRKQEAIEYFKKALSIDPNYKQAYVSMGFSLNGLNRNKEAIECYKKALSIDPNYKSAYNSMGFALNGLNKNKEAIECYKKALSIDPNYKQAYVSMGFILNELNRYQEAIVFLKKALQIDPNIGQACNNMGVALNALRKNSEATKFFIKAIELDPFRQDFLNNLIMNVNSSAQKNEALSFLKKVKGDHPECNPLAQAIRRLQRK